MSAPESKADRQRRIMATEAEVLQVAKAACERTAALHGVNPDLIWLQWLAQHDDDLGCQQSETTNAMAEAIATVEAKRRGTQ